MLTIITNANPNLLSRHHNTSRNNHNSHPDFCSTVTNTPQTSARYILLSISQPYRPRQQSAPYWLQVTIMSQNQLATRLTGKLINLKLIFSGWELTHRLTNNCIHSLYELQQNSATYPRQVALNYKNERPTLVNNMFFACMYDTFLSFFVEITTPFKLHATNHEE